MYFKCCFCLLLFVLFFWILGILVFILMIIMFYVISLKAQRALKAMIKLCCILCYYACHLNLVSNQYICSKQMMRFFFWILWSGSLIIKVVSAVLGINSEDTQLKVHSKNTIYELFFNIVYLIPFEGVNCISFILKLILTKWAAACIMSQCCFSCPAIETARVCVLYLSCSQCKTSG